MRPLLVCKCVSCGHVMWPPRLLCPRCGAWEAETIPAGPGLVRERTELTREGSEAVILVSVALDCGPWVIARTQGAAPGERVRLHQADDGAIHACT
jgi:uncharacterized protein